MHYYLYNREIYDVYERNDFSVKLTKVLSKSTSVFAQLQWQKYINEERSFYIVEEVGVTHKFSEDSKISFSSIIYPDLTVGYQL